MNFAGIAAYTARAAAFALVAGAVWTLVRRIRKGRSFRFREELRTLVFVMYAAALVHIIAIRQGPSDSRRLLLTPLGTTLGALREGAWPFLYHLVGNMIWFVPLGFFLPRIGKNMGLRRTALTGAAVSLSLEILQWLLSTGVTDVDDLIVNTLGTCAGYILHLTVKKISLAR